MIELSSGPEIALKPFDLQGLDWARPNDLAVIVISPSGLHLHFPMPDADVYLPGLLEGFLGSRKWMSASMGKVEGRSTSEAKAVAARANGTAGERPRKVASVEHVEQKRESGMLAQASRSPQADEATGVSAGGALHGPWPAIRPRWSA